MALFGKKQSTLEEVLTAYETLSDEDKATFEQSIKDRVDESVGEKENAEGQTDSQNAKDRVDEAIGEEQAVAEESESEAEGELTEEVTPSDGEVVPEDNGEVVSNEPVAEEPVAEEQAHEQSQEDTIAALTARLDALESKLAEYADIIKDFADISEDNGVLGVSGTATVGESEDALSEDDRIMQAYNPNWRRG